jgi:hypothetical protein
MTLTEKLARLREKAELAYPDAVTRAVFREPENVDDDKSVTPFVILALVDAVEAAERMRGHTSGAELAFIARDSFDAALSALEKALGDE